MIKTIFKWLGLTYEEPQYAGFERQRAKPLFGRRTWTMEEDVVLSTQCNSKTNEELAAMLNRSVKAVKTRKSILKKTFGNVQ